MAINKPYAQLQYNILAVETLTTADVQIEPKLQEHREMQPLREDIDELGSRWGVEDAKLFNNDMLTDEVEINLNILALILDMVGGEVHRILAIDQGDP